jgi:hypothetical protein
MKAPWGWLVSQRDRLGTIAVGHAANQAQIVLFDYALYPAVILWLGPLHGGAVMTALSAIASYLLILAYRWSGRDWLGLELVRELRDGPPPDHTLMRWMHRLLRAGQLPALLVLSIYYDPFITVVYLRDGKPGTGGLSRQDWVVFWSSVLVSNLYWTGAVTLLIELGSWLFR